MNEIEATSEPIESVAPEAAPEAEALPGSEVDLDLDNLATGSRWRMTYHIGEQSSDLSYGRIFKAADVGNAESFFVRLFKVQDDSRKESWEQLLKLKGESFIEVVEGLQKDGQRAEVVRATPSTTLNEWTAQRKLTQGEIELLVQQLAQAIDALHQEGLVHLNINTDTIFIKETDAGLRSYVGGFECINSFKGSGHLVHSVDPFFAPPECVGLYQFARDPKLRAWDWWSLGRVIQEVVLGRHVIEHILDRDVSKKTPELKTRAEDLLKEQDITKSRAGGVECMPAMDKRLTMLLRGLLTTSRDPRWGRRDVDRWLNKEEELKERYLLPKNERLFIWKEESYTVAEAAAMFAKKENWNDGLTNLFSSDNPDSLVVFMADGGVAHKVWQQAEILLKIVGLPLLKESPEALIKEGVAALVWATLAGGDYKIVVRGMRLDEACVRELLKPEKLLAGLGLVRVLILRTFLQNIEQLDPKAAQFLNEFEKISAQAFEVATKNNWLPDDPKLHARLMTLCLDSVVDLNISRAEMQRRYASTRDKLLDKFFKRMDCNRGELAVVIFTGTEPEKYKYVSREDWNLEQYTLLRERGLKLSAAIVWMRLARGMSAAPLVFGGMKHFVITWALIALLLILAGRNFPVVVMACVPAALVWFIRSGWQKIHKRKLNKIFPSLDSWGIWDGDKRCHVEAIKILQTDSVPGPHALLRSLVEINCEIKKLDLNPLPMPVPIPVGFRETWLAVGLGWMLFVTSGVAITWQAITNPFGGQKQVVATSTTRKESESTPVDSQGPADTQDRETTQAAEKNVDEVMVALANEESIKLSKAVNELRKIKEELDKLPKPPHKVAWGFKPVANPQVLKVRKVETADVSQVALAEQTAKLLLERFKPETINAIVAVQVPVQSGVGLMFYDGASGKLTGRDLVVINFSPLPRTWMELGKDLVFYLGTK